MLLAGTPIEEVAGRLEITPRALRWAFMAEVGMSISEWRRRQLAMKLDDAARRMRDGQPYGWQLLADIGWLQHESRFVAAFRRRYGMPPREYSYHFTGKSFSAETRTRRHADERW